MYELELTAITSRCRPFLEAGRQATYACLSAGGEESSKKSGRSRMRACNGVIMNGLRRENILKKRCGV